MHFKATCRKVSEIFLFYVALRHFKSWHFLSENAFLNAPAKSPPDKKNVGETFCRKLDRFKNGH